MNLPNITKIEIIPPSACPKCGCQIQFDGTWYFCPNYNCQGKVIGRVYKWIENLKIKFFGDEMAKGLVENGTIKSVADIYRVTSEQVSQLERFGPKHFQKMALHRKVDLTWAEILGSLSINHLNLGTSEKFVEEYPIQSIEDLKKAIEKEKVAKKMGPTKSPSITAGIIQNMSVIEDLFTLVQIKQDEAPVEGTLSGKVIVFTGSMSQSRSVLQKMAQDAGAQTPSSVNSKVTHLVCADPESGSSKLKKAEKMGIEIISEEEFMRLL